MKWSSSFPEFTLDGIKVFRKLSLQPKCILFKQRFVVKRVILSRFWISPVTYVCSQFAGTLSMSAGQGRLHGVNPGPSHRALCLEGSHTWDWFLLCCRHLEMLIIFEQGASALYFCSGPCKLCSQTYFESEDASFFIIAG